MYGSTKISKHFQKWSLRAKKTSALFAWMNGQRNPWQCCNAAMRSTRSASVAVAMANAPCADRSIRALSFAIARPCHEHEELRSLQISANVVANADPKKERVCKHVCMRTRMYTCHVTYVCRCTRLYLDCHNTASCVMGHKPTKIHLCEHAFFQIGFPYTFF